jgi:FkbH-like protein
MDAAGPQRKKRFFGGLLGRRDDKSAPESERIVAPQAAEIAPAFASLFGSPAAPTSAPAALQEAMQAAEKPRPQHPTPDPVDFLCPRDLQREPAPAARVLAIGSCFLEDLVASPEAVKAGMTSDFVLVNHVRRFPDKPPADIAGYDFQIVQIPLRVIMQDPVFLYLDDSDEAPYRDALKASCRALAHQVRARLRWTRDNGLLTFVLNFMLPQFKSGGRFQTRYDLRNVQYFVERLNQELERLVRECANAYIVDVDQLAASFGRRYVQDDSITGFNHGGIIVPEMTLPDRLDTIGPLSDYYALTPGRAFRDALLAEIQAMRATISQTDSVKLVVFDLDDTLWQGVAGEIDEAGPNMVEGWPVGVIEALHYLRKRGVLLGIISKNDEAVIRGKWDAILAKRLRLEDFADVRINWRPKPDNMRDMLKGVNLLPGNVVFVDDNPAERAQMQAAFPELRVIGGNPFLIRRLLLLSPQTQVAAVTAEARDRTRMVQAQLRRESERAEFSPEDFARQQDIRLTLSAIRSEEHPKFSRALELINKTNQFNTTGQRWTRELCLEFFAGGGWFAIYEVEDRYTAYGLVGIMLIKDSTIVQWVMSCRVMGMGVEFAALSSVVALLRQRTDTNIRANLVETTSNQPCRHVYAEAGFVARDDGLVLPGGVTPEAPRYVTISEKKEGLPS